MIENEYLVNPTEDLAQEFYNIECYIDDLNKSSTLKHKAGCYFAIGHAYYRLFRNDNPAAWLPWLVKCKETLLSIAEGGEKVDHLLLKVNNEIAIYYFDVCKDIQKAEEAANNSLEYVKEYIEMDDHFVPLAVRTTYEILGRCHEEKGEIRDALLLFAGSRGIIECLMRDYHDINYQAILFKIDSKIKSLREKEENSND